MINHVAERLDMRKAGRAFVDNVTIGKENSEFETSTAGLTWSVAKLVAAYLL